MDLKVSISREGSSLVFAVGFTVRLVMRLVANIGLFTCHNFVGYELLCVTPSLLYNMTPNFNCILVSELHKFILSFYIFLTAFDTDSFTV